MALWTPEQRERLAVEEVLLLDELPYVTFQNRAVAGQTTVWCEHITYRNNKAYMLCIKISFNYPFQMPNLYVTSPCPLYDYGGKILYNQTSHLMHTYKSDWSSYVKICHWKEENWSACNTLRGVFAKGQTWLESYEEHLRTEEPINNFSAAWN